MKLTLTSTLLFLGTAKFCSKDTKVFLESQNKLNSGHPPIYHKMEKVLGMDAASSDSLTAANANKFLNNFEKVFNSYKTQPRIMGKLYKQPMQEVAVKVIGGNWCSDTRYQVPCLCKVLHQLHVSPDSFNYYTVDRKKKALRQDFATTQEITKVPLIVVFKRGVEIGRIVESPTKCLEKDLLTMLEKAPL